MADEDKTLSDLLGEGAVITTLNDSDLVYVELGNPQDPNDASRVITAGDLRKFVAGVRWVEVTGNITLTDDHHGATLWITADAVVTLPGYANARDQWNVECVQDDPSSRTVSVATSGQGDAVRNSKTVLDGDGTVVKTPTDGTFATIGEWSAP